MKRSQLEHILRACKGTTDQTDFIVVGSQSILGRFPDAPRVLRRSMEADIYPKTRPELAPLLTGNLGELSLFHQTHGYWVDGVSPTTATLPAGWEGRLVKVCNENTEGAVGWCLEASIANAADAALHSHLHEAWEICRRRAANFRSVA